MEGYGVALPQLPEPNPRPNPNLDPNQEPEQIDMSGVVERTRNMLDPNLIIANDTYMSPLTALAQKDLVDLSVALNRGKQPTILALHKVPGRPEDVAAIPVLQRGANTVDVHWPAKRGKATLDLQRFLLHRQFTVPNGHRAFVPVERDNLAKLGECLIFNFSAISYAKIEPRGSRKPSSTAKKGGTAKAESAKAEGAADTRAPAKQPESPSPESE
jgi:hypothetical protein